MNAPAARANTEGALLFHRSEADYARVPHASALSFSAPSTATIELWMMPTEDPPIWHALGKRASCWNNSDLNYQCARDGTGFGFGTADCGCGTTDVPPIDQWTHVAITFDGAVARLYLNGTLVSLDSGCPLQGENAADLLFGGSDGCGDHFAGYLDEIRIWNYARSDSQIVRLMNLVTDAPIPGLVGCWHFDEEAGDQQILDSSGLGNAGTLGADGTVETSDPERVVSTAPLLYPPSAAPVVEIMAWGRVKSRYR